jgi:hypothetical protein
MIIHNGHATQDQELITDSYENSVFAIAYTQTCFNVNDSTLFCIEFIYDCASYDFRN